MKLLFRLTVLALAAVGARTLYERLRPRLETAGETGNRVVGETLTPAFRDAATTVKDASTQAVQDAATTMKDASTQAAREVVDATRDAADQVRESATDPQAGAPQTPTAPSTGAASPTAAGGSVG